MPHLPPATSLRLARTRLVRLLAPAGLALSLLLPAAAHAQGAAQTAPADPAVLRLGYIGTGKVPTAPSGWALQQGYLQRELKALGIGSVKTFGFPNGPDLNEALGSGALDVGIYGDTPAIVARARGFATRLIGFEQVGMDAWLVTPKNGTPSLEGLKGKVLAVPLGSYMHRYVIGVLKEAGLSGSVRVVYMLARDAEPALARGDIGAFAAQIEVGPLLRERGYPILDQASRHKNLVGSSVIVATESTLARHPNLQQAWQRARGEALAEIRKDPEKYYEFHARTTNFPVAAVRASYPVSQYPEESYPARGLELLESAKSFLLAENLIRQNFALANWRPGAQQIAGR
jgi:NitT/TauT family transport system substrate-binding protein/sulfonate transport system substrate-binding protein